MLRILVVDDDPDIRWSTGRALQQAGHDVHIACDGEEALQRLLEDVYQLVITDIRMPKCDGLSLFRHIRAHCPDTAVILITAYAAIEDAVDALKQGAYDYLTKPFDLAELVLKVGRIAEHQQLKTRLGIAQKKLDELETGNPIIGGSAPIVRLLEHIEMCAAADFPVLISGESGTGKELVAQRLHSKSRRSSGPFVTVNCAALPENLIEAELFGHERGSFTGAVRARKGRFRAAHRGTLFLDEIGDMPLHAQVRLLRVLQDSLVSPVGSSSSIAVDVRVIVATHKDLKQQIEAGLFREDLYFRINVLHLEIPPLRARSGDLPLLVQHFLTRNAAGAEPAEITPRAWAALAGYPFPGNVRELEHAIAHACVLARGRTIDMQHLPSDISGIATELRASQDPGFIQLRPAMRSYERQHILNALTRTAGKKNAAATLLGISRKSLWLKMRNYTIGPDEISPSNPEASPT